MDLAFSPCFLQVGSFFWTGSGRFWSFSGLGSAGLAFFPCFYRSGLFFRPLFAHILALVHVFLRFQRTHFLFDRIYLRPMSSMDPWRSVSAPYRRSPTPVVDDTIMPNSLPDSFAPHVPQFPFIASNSDNVFHPNSNFLPSPNHQFRLNSPIFNREPPPHMRSYSPLARNSPPFHSIHQYPTSNFAHVRNVSTSNLLNPPLQPFTSANIPRPLPFPPALTHSVSVDIKPIAIHVLYLFPLL